MRCTPSEHPILVTEPTWNTQANRERMAEIMFEEFQVPAFYIANTGVLNAYVPFLFKKHRQLSNIYRFAAGKGSALVIDVGQSMASVTPVVDGFVLRKGYATQLLADFVLTHESRRPFIFASPYFYSCSRSPYTDIADNAQGRRRANTSPADCE